MVWLFVGFVLGGTFGVVTMAFVQAALGGIDEEDECVDTLIFKLYSTF